MILLIDNYDSFSYNLYQMIGVLTPEITVARNDKITIKEARALRPDGVILSPGPGRPEQAGVSVDLVKALRDTTPILGVCLGHQAICYAYGAKIGYAKRLMHGKQSDTTFDLNSRLFRGLPERAVVGRYHSLAVDRQTLPVSLRVTAETKDGEVMAVEAVDAPVYGVQFHPESILTPDGRQILQNFVQGVAMKGA